MYNDFDELFEGWSFESIIEFLHDEYGIEVVLS